MKPKFNYQSLRAEKARLTVGVSKIWRFVLWLLTIMLIIIAVAMFLIKNPISYLLFGLAPVPWMLYQYWRWELYRLDVDDKSDGVESIMSSSVLGRLSPTPTPQELAQIIGKTSSGQFILVRFGVSSQLLQEMASAEMKAIEQIWQLAIEIRQQTKSETISGGVLALAIIKKFPNHEAILAHLRLDFDDLLVGVAWHDRVFSKQHEKRLFIRTGGVARDWSFGYTPLLNRFGQNISESLSGRKTLMAEIDSQNRTINNMMNLLAGPKKNVALIGDFGVGKTRLVTALAEKLINKNSEVPASLRFNQIFLLNASSLISATDNESKIEGLIISILNEAYKAKNIIVCLDNAEVFFEDGTGSLDLTKVLLPIIEAGNIKMILTINQQKMLQIAAKQPAINNALNRLNLSPTNQAETMVVLQDKIIELERKNQVVYMYQALKEAYRLGERYVHDEFMPGQAIKVLEMAAHQAKTPIVRFLDVQNAIEQNFNVKVSVASTANDKQKLLNLETIIAQQMVGQVHAVKNVSDALRRAVSGVRNQNRPIGTFLFLGPTGVGKTQLAKTLSEVYFGEKSLIRIDLNEFVKPDDVDRLIADGANNPRSLTAQVMQRPFSVILLDEIEKAHPSVLATLLQVLDEGVLRDVNNKEINFRDAIIIATSNAGALEIQNYIKNGVKIRDFQADFINELLQKRLFTPEFLNRFDEIILFAPLTKEDLNQIINLILVDVNKNLVNQKIQVKVSDEAKQLLVEKGYNPELGARPLRRIVQKTVENIVAKAIIADEVNANKIIEIGVEQIHQNL